MATRVKRIMTQPINLIFRYLQSKTRVQIWVYEMNDLRIEGVIVVSVLVVTSFDASHRVAVISLPWCFYSFRTSNKPCLFFCRVSTNT